MISASYRLFTIFISLAFCGYLSIAPEVISYAHADAGYLGNMPPVNYVALGDSRAADPQNGGIGSSCDRSSFSYPNMIASIIPVRTFANVSCVGATIYNFYYPQPFPFRTVPPQLNALNSSTDIVTLSIGGNDISWFHLIQSCFTKEFHQDAHCRDDLGVGIIIDSKLKELATHLDQALKSIRNRAPSAAIFVVGHGGYYGSAPCDRYVQISPEDLLVVHDFFAKFNRTMAEAATKNHDYFVDIESHTHGHDACATNDKRWFTGNIEIDNTPRRHPTELGSNEIGKITAHYIMKALNPDHSNPDTSTSANHHEVSHDSQANP